ncbi:Na(+)-translocating NADH-quinone reductase subunit A [Thorsellia anophelis]|uniref:Na(+)-translocating NADH-quinone reductase subunit A n=1 Tax=Thorsellia anophelis DSM 18579 TaxID=1123402 RepID=A0A1H9YMF0_9GAMM|nr:Na(+)-translocating NADH-quinone reductase subunit A [Thorsellia anophelis]SES70229.1 Na+-transporting NADH:ubiquinone oxidoreductase subunit A [Thorsellia anophelis DSM 18579]
MIRIQRGLDIPIAGIPEQNSIDAKSTTQQAIIGFDYPGLKPSILVEVGQQVKLGQSLLLDKKNQGVVITAPCAGKVIAINRGEKRIFQSIVIESESLTENNTIVFESFDDITVLSETKIREQLQQSGLWSAFRTRPYSKIPAIDAKANSIFVNAMDTHPLAADPQVVIKHYQADFDKGLAVIAKLAPVNLCVASKVSVTQQTINGVSTHEFSGPHPAGLSGTHIHFIDPVSANKTVWTVNYQDVIAIGKLMTTGRLWTERVISLAGPIVKRPRLMTVPVGAFLDQIIQNELNHPLEKSRVISGSILGGRHATNAFAFLGRYHLQVSCIAEAERPEILDYVRPTGERFSAMNLFFSKLFKRKLNLTTNTEGEPRHMVPFGNYELIMPLDILPTQLLRALIIGDTDMAQKLGCLELDEEDLALCSYVCAGKYEYGPILRAQLARIEVEG